MAISPSCMKYIFRVCSRSAGTSEATKTSSSEIPKTRGGPLRAAMIVLGQSARDHADCIASAQLLQRCGHRFGKGFARHQRFHQMRNNLGVGLGDKPVIAFLQPGLQLEIIFDDPVMNHHDLPAAVTVRVCILFCWAAMRCPTGVADSVLSRPGVPNPVNGPGSPAFRKPCEPEPGYSAQPRFRRNRSPRYSSFFRPSIMTETTGFGPTYPTIPHMEHS